MPRDLSRRSLRDAMKLACKAALRRAVGAADVDLLEVAEACGVGPTMPSRWASRKTGDVVSIVDVVLVGKEAPSVAHAIMRWAGEELGLVVAPRIAGAAHAEHLEHAAVMATQSAEALAAYLGALADGRFDDAELDRLDRELRGAEEAHAALRSWIGEERARRTIERARGTIHSIAPNERRSGTDR